MNKLCLLSLIVLTFGCSEKVEPVAEKNDPVEAFQFKQIERAKGLESTILEKDKLIENVLDSQENKVPAE